MNMNISLTPYEKPRYEGIVDIMRRYNILDAFGVEIGVQRAYFSSKLLSSGVFKKLFLVDLWEDHEGYDEKFHDHSSNYLECVKVMSQFPEDKYEVMKMESTKASEVFPVGSLDFVYLDANHSYEGVKNDIAAWYPKLKKGGILCGDDYHLYPTFQFSPDIEFGVTKAVDEFAIKHKRNISTDLFADWCVQIENTFVPVRNWWLIV